MQNFDFKKLIYEWLELKNMGVKESTYFKYETIIRNHIEPYFKDMALEDFTDHTIIIFFNEKKERLSDSYLRIIKYVLNAIIELGKEKYSFPNMHIELIKFSNDYQEKKVLSYKQKTQLLEYCHDYHNQLSVSILISLYSGLRIGEICALRWKDIDFQNEIIHVTSTAQRRKTKNTQSKTQVVITSPKSRTSLRLVPVPIFLMNYLKDYKKTEEDNAFVLSNSLSIYEPRQVQKRFKRLCEKNQFEINFHVLRHSYATECVRQSVDIKSLSEMLGHAKVSTTLDLYVHTNIEYKKKEIEKIPTPSWT